MLQVDRRLTVGFRLVLVVTALAPAPPQQRSQVAPPPVTAAQFSQIRVEAGKQTFDMAWLYYSENRIDADKVYRWSKRYWEAERDAATTKEERIGAAEGHLSRMRKLEAKITRIRRIGFGDSLDVLEAGFYRKEAEFWRADAEAR